jgi:hypothetical protein
MHLYKTAIAQKLKGSDCENRTKLCRDLLNVRVTDVVFFSDEAHFHLSGTVNKQNFRYWSESNPREFHRAGYDLKVTVWCAVFNFGVLGPYFFEEDNVTVTVNSDCYCAMLQNFFQPRLDGIFNDQHGADNVWFRQDGATAYTSHRSLSLLREMSPGHVISLRGDIGWPPRSPDLTPCNFFLWGYLKAKVYEQRPLTLEALKEAIRQEVSAITPEMILKVMDNYRERLHQCINIQGCHLSDVLFKTH